MSTQNEAERLARAWIECWSAGKPEDIPLGRDFVHASPFDTIEGRDKYLEWVRPLAAKNVTSLKIVRILPGDGEAAIWFEMGTPKGVVQCCDWVRTDDGLIVGVTSFFDPTGLR